MSSTLASLSRQLLASSAMFSTLNISSLEVKPRLTASLCTSSTSSLAPLLVPAMVRATITHWGPSCSRGSLW